jgi:hypothetical protein
MLRRRHFFENTAGLKPDYFKKMFLVIKNILLSLLAGKPVTASLFHPPKQLNSFMENQSSNPNGYASRIPHPASRIPHPASRIPHPASRIPHPAMLSYDYFLALC